MEFPLLQPANDRFPLLARMKVRFPPQPGPFILPCTDHFQGQPSPYPSFSQSVGPLILFLPILLTTTRAITKCRDEPVWEEQIVLLPAAELTGV